VQPSPRVRRTRALQQRRQQIVRTLARLDRKIAKVEKSLESLTAQSKQQAA
jgi:hypothetical protein